MVKLKDMPKSLACDLRDLKRKKKRFSHHNRARDPKNYMKIKLLGSSAGRPES